MIKQSARSKSARPAIRVAMYHRIAWSFLAATGILVLLIVALSLNRMVIVFSLETKPAATDFTIPIYEQAPQTDGTFLVGQFFSLELAKEATFTAEEGAVVDDYAQGPVTVINKTKRIQPLVATTRLLSSDEKLFRITKSITVPANGQVSVTARADQPGPSHELSGAVKFTIPGLRQNLQTDIYAVSDGPMTGGTKRLSVITEKDTERARQNLEAALLEQAKEEFNTLLETSQTPTSGRVIALKVISFSHNFDPKKSEEQNTVSASMKTQATLFAFDEAALLERAKERLEDGILSNYILKNTDRGSFSYVLETQEDKSGALLTVHLEGQTIVNPDDPAFNPAQWVNQPIAQLKEQLKTIEGVTQASVETSSFWTDRSPRDPKAITVRFAQ